MVLKKSRYYISLVLKCLLIATGSTLIPAKYIQVQRTALFLLILNYILLFHSVIWSAVNSSNIAVISESLSYSMTLVSSFLTVFIIRLNKRIFTRVIQCLNNEPENIIRQTNTQFFSTLKMVFKVIFIMEMLYLLTGVTASSTSDIELGSQESQYSPGYIPWNPDTPLKYGLSVLYQTLLMGYPFTINYSVYAALVGFYTFINFKYQQLFALIDNLPSSDCSIPPRDPDYQYDYHLVQVIRSYQNWKRLSKEIATFVGGYSSAVLFCVISCSVWNTSMITESKIPISVKIRSVCFLIYIIVQLIMVCLLGEYFQEKDSEIGNAVYNTSWYSRSHQSRKITFLFLLLTQRTTRVKAYGMIPINTHYYLRVLKTIYSALNLYRESYTKKSITT